MKTARPHRASAAPLQPTKDKHPATGERSASSPRRAHLALLAIAAFAPSAFAQFTSNVRGVVTDTTGAIVPNATVLLQNLNTGTRQTIHSDGSGNYRFNSVAPGRYKVTVQAAGFGIQAVETVLTTEQTAAVDLKLSAATVNQQIDVNGTAGPLLNTDETRLQVTVDKSQIDELPLQNRNIYSIVTIAPGVTGFVDAGSSDNFVNENRVQASANGHFSGQNEYLLDGFSISSAVTGGTANVAPNPDSVQEAALQTNNFSVENGQGSSIQVEITTRSGANAFHGSANYLYTDNNLKRFGYFQKFYNPFRRHDVSVSVGGPIIKDHLFFFGSTEIKRRLVPAGTGSQTAETPAFVAYGKSKNPNGLGVSLFSRFPAALVGTSTLQTAGQILGCKNGNTTDTGAVACATPFIVSGQNARATPDNGRQYNFRIDYTTLTGKDKAYANYYNTTNDAAVILNRPGFDVHTTLTNFFLSANYTHIFGDRLVNQASFADYGVKGLQAQDGDYTIPTISFTQISSTLGVLNGPGIFQQANYSYRDVLSYVRGRHSLRLGGVVRYENDKANFGARRSRPVYAFQTVLDMINDAPLTETNVTFDPLTGVQKLNRFGGQDTLFGLFVNDDFKLTPHLLLSFGLRYDDFGNVTPYGFPAYNQTANIVLGTGNDYLSQIAGAHAVVGPGGIYNGRRGNNWSPRGSFAYSPNSSTSIRGGMGLYLDEIGLGQVVDRINTNPPTFVTPTFDSRAGIAPIFSIGTTNKVDLDSPTTNPFGFTLPSFRATGVDARGGIPGANLAVNSIDPNIKLPKSLNYVLGAEQQVGKTTVFGVNYSGSYSYDQLVAPNLNRAPGSLNVATNIKTLPNTSFGDIVVAYNGGYGHYDALVATLRQRYADWLSYEASYTWSHSRDIGIGGTRTNLTIGQDDYPDPTNIGRYYANSSFDTRNRITVAGSVKSPFHHRGFSKLVLDDYELSTIAVGQSGQPFSVFNSNAYRVVNGVNVGGDYQAEGYNYAFPNAPAVNYARPRTKSEYINGLFAASEFTAPPVGTFIQGTETRSHYVNPGLLNIDASIIKGFGYTRGDHTYQMKLRGDFYNVINRTNLTGVTSNVASATFGRSTNNYQPRTIQIGARLEF